MRRVPRAFVLACSSLCVATVATACGRGGTDREVVKRAASPIDVSVARVTVQDLSYVVEGNGSLEAYQVVTVAAALDGRVESVAFDEGDAVSPATTLAVVDATRRALDQAAAEAEVKRAEAAIPTATAALARVDASIERVDAQRRAAETDLAEATGMLARREAVRKQTPGAVSEEDLETMRSTVARRRDAVTVAAAQVDEARVSRRQAEASLAESEVAAASARARLALATRAATDAVVHPSIAGTVRRRLVTPGQYVHPGDPIAEIVDRERLRVRFRVGEAESTRLSKDMTATFRIPSLSDAERTATIVHVDEAASAVTRTVECLADVTSDRADLKPGFYAVVRVETKRARAIAVPEDALQPGERGWVAFVVVGDKAVRRALTLGLHTDGGLVEVVAGLVEGDDLVVRGGNILADGSKVRVAAPAGAAPTGSPAAPVGPR